MRVGSIDLSSASVVATSKYDYYKSDGGEIIGGVQTITISGSVVVDDDQSSTPGSLVMGRLQDIVKLGQDPKCITVNIPGQYSGQAKIENVTANQGSDPAWINKGEFSIELKAPLQSIPTNSFNITAQDSVTQISRSSKIEFPEDHHGYLYDGSFHKTYVIQSNETNFTCEPICQPNFSLINVIDKLSSNSLHPSLSKFSSYNKYGKTKSVQVSGNSATIKTEYILTPHNGQAFTDLNFSHNRSYGDSPSTKKIISGTITGLTDSNVFDSNGMIGTCVASRLANAESVFGQISARFANISSWEGIELELLELPNPFTNNIAPGCIPVNNINKQPCIKPSLSTVARSRTDGTIDFTFEWSTSENCSSSNNRVSTDFTIDIIEPQLQFVEHVIPGYGTLIQNLNTRNARRINIQIVTTYPQDLCGPLPPICETDNDMINEILNKYNITNAILIKDTLTTSKRSITKDQTYIQCN